jgi:hypothetical protein
MNALLVCVDDTEAETLHRALIEADHFPLRRTSLEQAQKALEDAYDGQFSLVLIHCSGHETRAVLVALGQLAQSRGAVYVLRCHKATWHEAQQDFPQGTRFIGTSPLEGRHYASPLELPQRLRI